MLSDDLKAMIWYAVGGLLFVGGVLGCLAALLAHSRKPEVCTDEVHIVRPGDGQSCGVNQQMEAYAAGYGAVLVKCICQKEGR